MKNQTVIFDTIVPHPTPVQAAEILNEIEAVIKKHVILNDHAAAALAVWVLHTYTFNLRDTVAYVAIESPEKRCGKTTLLSVLAAMAHKPLIASNVTVGALFRAIDTCRPTLFIDEADTFLAGNGTLRGIINSGNTWRTAYVLRLSRFKKGVATQGRLAGTLAPPDQEPVMEGRFADGSAPSDLPAEGGDTGLKKYSCWCPKVIAMIGRVPDTIADRSIVVSMTRKLVTETCAPLAELNPGEIKSKCARFALDAGPSIAQSVKIRIEGLNDRAADTFDPLFAIARHAGEEWERKLRAAALALNSTANHQSSGAELLLDVLSIFILSGREKIFSRDLINALRDGGGGMKSFALKYSTINEYRISQILRPYGIRPSTFRIGQEVNRGYVGGEFRDALARYVPEDDARARAEQIRHQSRLQTEARAEAQKEQALLNQMLAQVPQDNPPNAPDAAAILRKLQEEADKQGVEESLGEANIGSTI